MTSPDARSSSRRRSRFEISASEPSSRSYAPPARVACLILAAVPGALMQRLVGDGYEHVVGVDVSVRALEIAARRLRLDEMHDAQRQRIALCIVR